MEIKKLTEKFRENFKKYDYNNEDNIDVLLALVDTIIDMISIVSNDDCVEYVSKLSLFLKMLSGDEIEDPSDIKVMQNIFDISISSILDYFDNKYGESEDKDNIVKCIYEVDELLNPVNNINKIMHLNSKDIYYNFGIADLYPKNINIIKDNYDDKIVSELDKIKLSSYSNRGHPNN